MANLRIPKKKGLGKWLFDQIRGRIPALAVLLCSTVLAAYLGVVFSLATRQVIDSAVAGDAAAFVRACGYLAAIIVVRVAGNALALHLNERLVADLDRDIKKNVMHKILRSDYRGISQFHSGDLLSRMNGDVSTVYTGILAILTSFASMAASLVTAVVLLMDMAPGFTVAIVGISAAIALATLLIQRRMKQLHKQASAAGGKVSGFLQESIENLLMIQALDVAPEIERRADRILEQRWQILRRRKNINLSMNLGASALGYIGGLITLVWCAAQLLEGKLSFGGLTAMTQLVSQLQSPMLTLPRLIPRFISILAAGERLMEIEEIPDQPAQQQGDAARIYREMTGIAIENLSFAYDREPVMDQVSLTIPKGGLTVIVGASGIGKSTLLKLLLGIYSPASGQLYIESPNSKLPVSRAARSLFSYAPQGNLLLSGTLRENLLLTRPDATEEEVNRALYVSCLDETVATLPQGLDTPLRENAAGLSEGQAQRLSLARAVLSGAPILLLDEVTSALDAGTEQIVLQRICALPDKTCIAVTHRPAALKLASHVITVTQDDMTIKSLH